MAVKKVFLSDVSGAVIENPVPVFVEVEGSRFVVHLTSEELTVFEDTYLEKATREPVPGGSKAKSGKVSGRKQSVYSQLSDDEQAEFRYWAENAGLWTGKRPKLETVQQWLSSRQELGV